MNENIGIIVTARVNSKRLPSKVLQLINHKPTIEILLDHVISDMYPVVLAIPKSKGNDVLEEIAERKGIDCYRGEDESPLHRLYSVALNYGFDHIVRITADDILIDQLLMRNQIKFHLKGGWDYTWSKKSPEGTAGEIIKTEALERLVSEFGDSPCEFVSYYFKTSKFKYREFYPPYEYHFNARLTLDYPEDLMLLRVLFASLPGPIGTLDVIHFLKKHMYFLEINKLPEVTIYTCNYNTEPYIIDCMESVFKQEFGDYEYIVLDDASSDDSMKTITSFYSLLDPLQQKKTKIYRNYQNMGLPACCNKVLEMARGKYIIRVDSDDVLNPDHIKKMIEKIKLDDVEGVCSGYEETKSRLTSTAQIIEPHRHPASCLLSRWHVNELKYKEDLKYLEGDEFFDRFEREYKMSFLPEVTWKYRQHEAQKTKQADHPNNGE